MARPKTPDGEPTRMEMDILQVLWKDGPSTVRHVTDELNKTKDVAYTTTLKIMQLMHGKGMMHRDGSAMTHIYIAAMKEEPVKKAMLQRFVQSVYRGSKSQLMLQLLGSAKKPSKEELALLKDLLKKIEKK
jgi:BlaI family transcriptional regulator, penicillinase repressor